MAFIEGAQSRTFVVSASPERVLTYFSDPEQFRDANAEVESLVESAPGTWRFTLKAKSEKGITFQGVYDVRYSREEQGVVRWETVCGNMRTSGLVRARALSEAETEVVYEETMAPDLPIPALLARVFKPIVAREVQQGINTFLDRSSALLNAKA